MSIFFLLLMLVLLLFFFVLGLIVFYSFVFVVVTVHHTFNTIWIIYHLNQEEGKFQELIHSSTTPDPCHFMGKLQKQKKKNHTQERHEASPFPAGDRKAAMNRQDRMTKTNTKQK